MRIKKIVFLTIIALIFCCDVVSAKTVCEYRDKDSVQRIELHIGSNELTIKEEGEIQLVEFGFKASKYLEGNCPHKLYVIGNVYYEQLPGTANVPDKTYYIVEDKQHTVDKVSCGEVTDIPTKFPELTSMFVVIIQVAVPVVLIIMGMMDLFKGITAQKEDEIKKGQQLFIKRLVVAAMIFFVLAIVRILISLLADTVSESDNIIECIDCFISGVNNCN